MRAAVLVAVSNLRRRPLLAILMGIVLAVSALLLATSLGLVTGLARPVERAFEELAGSHLVLECDSRTGDPRAIAAWWSAQDGVLAATAYAVVRPEGRVLFRSRELGRLTLLSERPDPAVDQDRVRIVAGPTARAPGPGEVWVPTGMAYGMDPPVSVGEVLTFPAGDRSVELRVSAIVVDPFSSAAAVEPVRMWVAPGALAASFPLTELGLSWVGIRLADAGMVDALWDRFQASLPAPFGGLRVAWADLMDAYVFVQRLVALLLLVFASLSAAIILLILSFTVSAAILSDYRAIGIFKSQGFTSAQVASAYVMQHLLVTLAAAPLGVAGSAFAVRLVAAGLVRALGLFDAGVPLLVPGLATVLALVALVTGVAALSARRVGRIRPAEAMRFGAPMRETAGRRGALAIRLSRLPVSIGLGLRQLAVDRRRSVLLFASLGLTVFVFVLAVNTVATFRDVGSFGPALGLDASDVMVVRSTGRFAMTHEALVAELAADPEVAAAVPARIGGVRAVLPAAGTRPARVELGSAYDGDMDLIGLQNLRGRNPRAANEISLAAGTARDYGREPGDWFDVVLEGSRFRFLVTGIYQSTSNFGQGFRMPMAALRAANPAFEPVTYPVKLRSGADVDLWVADWTKRFGAALVVQSTRDMIRRSGAGVTTSVSLAVVTLAGVFALVAAVIVFNSTVIRIAEQRSTLGVLKSVGMSQGQLAAAQAVTVLALAALATAAGLPLALVASPRLMAVLGSSLGLVRFPMMVAPVGTAVAALAAAAIALAGCLAAARRILSISPRVLIRE